MVKFPDELPVGDGFSMKIRKPEDAEAFFEVTDRNRDHLREWLPWLDKTTSVEYTRGYISKCLANIENGTAYDVGMYYEGSWVGSIGLNRIDHVHKTAEIGYWIDRAFAGKGLVTKAVQALMSYAFDEVEIHRLVIMAAVGNSKSRAVPERLGFTQEGISREAEWLYDHFVDLVVYSLLKPEWESSRRVNG